MESDISSSLSLENVHADSLIWTNKNIEGEHSDNLISSNIIDGNQKSLNLPKNKSRPLEKDDILSFIKPDYGSLGQFINDINLNTNLLRQKKKKNDGQQQAQQKKIRQHLQNRNLNKILSNPQSTYQQRSVACKLLIERSFQQAFGSSINQFYQQQVQRLEPQQKKSTLNIQNLSDVLDEIVNKSQQRFQQKPSTAVMYSKQNLKKNRASMRGHTYIMKEKQTMLKKITNAKNMYRSLQKAQLPNQTPKQFIELQQKYGNTKQIRSNMHNRQSSYSSSSSHQAKSMFKQFEGKTFVVRQTEIIMVNLYEISTQTLLYALAKINFEAIEEIVVINTTVSNVDAFLLFLDVIGLEAKNLKSLVLEDLSSMFTFKNREKFSQKIKNIIETASQSIKALKLNQLGLETKDFCLLCLGIGSSRYLELVEMKNNKIDEHGKKSYDVITKFFKNLEINLQGNFLYNQINMDKLKSSKVIPS